MSGIIVLSYIRTALKKVLIVYKTYPVSICTSFHLYFQTQIRRSKAITLLSLCRYAQFMFSQTRSQML